MRRPLTLIAGAAALAATLAACGDSDGGGDTAGCSPIDSSFTVNATDQLKFDADTYEATAGCIEVTYRNDGNIAHTLLVKDQPGLKLAIGDEDTGTIALDAGSYTLYCDVPGHESAGMRAEVKVS